jgi:hypothetical protein
VRERGNGDSFRGEAKRDRKIQKERKTKRKAD